MYSAVEAAAGLVGTKPTPLSGSRGSNTTLQRAFSSRSLKTVASNSQHKKLSGSRNSTSLMQAFTSINSAPTQHRIQQYMPYSNFELQKLRLRKLKGSTISKPGCTPTAPVASNSTVIRTRQIWPEATL